MKSGKAPYVPRDALQQTLAAQLHHRHARRDRAILMVSHYLGLRAMEIASLRVRDVFDPRAGQVRELVRLLSSMTKGEKYREVFLVNGQAREAVRLHLLDRGVHDLDGPLFVSQRGGAFSANSMQRLMAICYRRAGVRASSHSGRRSFATNLIQNGADIFSVMQMMGHTHIGTTQVYFSSNPERLKRLAAQLG